MTLKERAAKAAEKAAAREARWYVKWDALVKLCRAGNVNRRARRARTVVALRWYVDQRAKRAASRMFRVMPGL